MSKNGNWSVYDEEYEAKLDEQEEDARNNEVWQQGFAAGWAAAMAAAARSDCQLCHDGLPVYHYVNGDVEEWYHMIGDVKRNCKAGHLCRLTPPAPGPARGGMLVVLT